MSVPLPPHLKSFVSTARWTFARTYASTWPHEYIVRGNVDEGLFVELVQHIRKHGYDGDFYARRMRYFDEDGLVYWTMGAPIEETIIVNRCREDQTYAYRLAHGTLPESARTPRRRPASTHPRDAIDLLAEIGRSAPMSEWKKFPRDLAKNFDHYAHGSPRED